MTISMQDKLTAEITRVITAAGLEVTRQPQFANTGVLYAQRGFDTFLAVHYDFQDRYCGFRLTGTAVDEAPPERRGRSPQAQYRERRADGAMHGEIEFHYLEYHKGDEIRAVPDLIGVLLEPGAAPDCYPWAVVVDVRGSYVYTAGADGIPFTPATGQAFADLRNSELEAGPAARDQPHQVFRLIPGGDTSRAEDFVRLVAGMTMDGERGDGDRYEQRPGDAIDTLQSLISRARDIRDRQATS